MSSQLVRLADSLVLLARRLRLEAAQDDGALREKFGGAISELFALRTFVNERIAAGDKRTTELQRIQAVLADIAQVFDSLPYAPPVVEPRSRPAARRRRLLADRLDASTRRLLKRTALAIGISGAGALALASPSFALAGCTGTTSQVCDGLFVNGIQFGFPVISITLNTLTGAITPPAGTHGIALTSAGSEGTHHGAGSDGEPGGPAADLSITSKPTNFAINVTGDHTFGITAQSTGGGAGNGGGGLPCAPIPCVSGGDGGPGGDGGNVTIWNWTNITSNGANSAGIFALSHGGQGGSGGDSNGGPHAGTGGPGGNADFVKVTNSGTIGTQGLQAHGIYAASIGGNGGSGGGGFAWAGGGAGGTANRGNDVTIINTVTGTINTTGENAIGIYGESIGGFGGSGGDSIGIFGYGGGGSLGGDSGKVTITNDAAVTTTGKEAYAIFAQSVGGGGGNGGSGAGIVGLGASGDVGGKSDAVSVTNSGTLHTSGEGARGIFAQSIGGGGGNGGNGAGLGALGGTGSGTSPGGTVYVSNSGNITTTGNTKAYAIEAQSIGGGGGDGGSATGPVSVGGDGGAGGDSKAVEVHNTGTLSTAGNDSSAMFVQSVGGGGGNGGNAVAVSAQIAFSLGGNGGPGGNGDAVIATSGTGSITTTGDRSNGIQAQSVGGGGGNGGFAISASAGLYFSLSSAIGGRGGHGGDAFTVDLTNTSIIHTSGADSHGIFAQSVGGGGGSGGMAIALSGSNGIAGSFAMGGHGADGGNSNIVTLSNSGNIFTTGYHSYGILAQSIGGGGGDGGLAATGAVGMNGALGLALGGHGGGGGIGNQVHATNTGHVETSGDEAIGILVQSVGGGGGTGGATISGSISTQAAFSIGVGGDGGAGEDANTAYLNTSGGVVTDGTDAHGVVVQSIGGSGGNGGFAIAAGLSKGYTGTAAVGGKGAYAGNAFNATLISAGDVTTIGAHSYGLFVQSVGGGGGDGGFAISGGVSGDGSATIAIGGSGDGGGKGGTVDLTSNSIVTTWGAESIGVLAQSIGGGGGSGGLAISAGISNTATFGFGLGGSGKGGGDADVVHAMINDLVTTHGNLATGILVQSVGGGGGNGGGSIGAGASKEASVNLTMGGSGAGAGDGKYVELHNNSGAVTFGDMADGVLAQSVGGGGGNGGFAVGGVLSKGYAGNATVGGTGGGGGNASDVLLTGNGDVTTWGFKSFGIIAQSVGGGGGNGGFSVAGSIGEGDTASIGVGGNGKGGGNAGHVTLITGSDVTTHGADSIGILAHSIGGGGGNGGFAITGNITEGNQIGGLAVSVGGKGDVGGNAGLVDLTSTGTIITTGAGSHGIVAESIGGGGGNGGFAGAYQLSLGDDGTATFGVGGDGKGGGDGMAVNATVSGSITTMGDGAYGLFAQSVGGGGGDGGWGMAISIQPNTGGDSKGALLGAVGGKGAKGGHADTVTVINTAAISTAGAHSYGILAQSLGGGGGNGGFAASGTIDVGKNATVVGVTVGGAGGPGNDAGAVVLTNSGTIVTTGGPLDPSGSNIGTDAGLNKTGSIGILAQSIGGGGGNGGGAFSGVIAGPDNKNLSVNVGGFGGDGGIGNTVFVHNLAGGAIETDGAFAYGIEAQSIGGGGGNGGMSISAVLSKGGEGTNVNAAVTVGGFGGDGSYAQLVHVINNATITTHGAESTGILAQSIGGGGGNGGAAITAILGVSSADPAQSKSRTINVGASIGGLGGDGSNGGKVVVENTASIITWGDQSEGINAQSIGGGGGKGGNANTMSFVVAGQCTLPGVCGSPDSSARNYQFNAAVGGNGGGASDGDDVTVTNSGIIFTHGNQSDGIFAQSIGGGGGTGGNGTLGSGGVVPIVPLDFLFLPVSNVKIWNQIKIAVGGNAGAQGNGHTVTVNNTAGITTLGDDSIAIAAQSVGGGGGFGGTADSGLFGLVGIGGKGGAGGNGGIVNVTNSGALLTSGEAAYGIFAQSVGGGGGMAGNVKRGLASLLGTKNAVGIGLAFGQGGGDGGDGNVVTVINTGSITTHGDGAHGIFAQSVGGGGGVLGDLGNAPLGGLLDFFIGSVGDKGDGKAVTVTQNGNVTTTGTGAAGVFAQSAGGQGTGGAVAVGLNGNIATSGNQSAGILAQSVGIWGGNTVTIAGTGNITTSGTSAYGIVAESFGAASLVDGVVTQTDAATLALPYFAAPPAPPPSGVVTITRGGTIHTTGAGAHGIMAHSVSSTGPANAVNITYSGSIFADGSNADAIVAQSTGFNAANGNITIALNGSANTVSGGQGTGAAVRLIGGLANVVNNNATVTTLRDLAGVTIVGGGGNDDIENFGTYVGQIALDGGTNKFRNRATGTLVAGALFDLGAFGNNVINEGALSVGHIGQIFTTTIVGGYQQASTGHLDIDVDWGARTADRLNVNGAASLSGDVVLSYLNIPLIRPGTTNLTIEHADGNTTNAGLTLTHQQSAIVNYSLTFPNPKDVVLGFTVDFAPLGAPMNANDHAVGEYFNAMQTAGSSPGLAPVINAIFQIPDNGGLHDLYQHLSPEPFLAGQFETLLAGAAMSDSLLSCHPYAAGEHFRFTDEGTCTWFRVAPKTINLTHTAGTMGSRTAETEYTIGHQHVIDENWRIGIAGAYDDTSNHVETFSNSHGQRIAGGLVVKGIFDPYEFALAVNGGSATIKTHRYIGFPFGTVAESSQRNTWFSERLRASWQAYDDDMFYVRPMIDINSTQLQTGGFTETGAGALNLVVKSANHTYLNVAGGAEIGTEFTIDGGHVLRPFISYQLVGVLTGRTQEITAGFEGAPAGITPFTVTNPTDTILNQVSAGLDLIRSDDYALHFNYTGQFGSKSSQSLYAVKLSIPF